MSRVRSQIEIAQIRRAVEAEQAALYPDDEVIIAVSKISPPRSGAPDWIITRYPKAWAVS
jgi:hypothetical protein